MANRAVVIAPTSDFLVWGSCVLERVVRSVGYVTARILYGPDATPWNARRAILDLDPAFVAGIGHGHECVYTVQNKRPFIMEKSDKFEMCTENMNLDIVAGRVWHLNSCVVGAGLGRSMVERYGAVAFAGSKDEFLFYIGEPPCSSVASMAVFIAEYEFTRQLLLGNTVGRAHEARLAAYDRMIDYFTTGPGSGHEYAPLITRILIVDKNIAVLYGDSSATVAYPTITLSDIWNLAMLYLGTVSLIGR